MKLILASASPRRAEILTNAGIAFDVLPAAVDESRLPNEMPPQMVRRLAEAKARAVAANVKGGAIVIGADTIVALGSVILGKPASAENAREMLRLLSGKKHAVITGIAAIRLPDGATRVEEEVTEVTFAELSEKMIRDYVASSEPMGKAGAYAIQGAGGRFIPRIEGCYFNVVGLPLSRLSRLLTELGWKGEQQPPEMGEAARSRLVEISRNL